jgi:hypothetical protein
MAVKSASVIILQALPIALAIFVLFPRLEAPRWMWLKDDSKAVSGLTNTLELGCPDNPSPGEMMQSGQFCPLWSLDSKLRVHILQEKPFFFSIGMGALPHTVSPVIPQECTTSHPCQNILHIL